MVNNRITTEKNPRKNRDFLFSILAATQLMAAQLTILGSILSSTYIRQKNCVFGNTTTISAPYYFGTEKRQKPDESDKHVFESAHGCLIFGHIRADDAQHHHIDDSFDRSYQKELLYCRPAGPEKKIDKCQEYWISQVLEQIILRTGVFTHFCPA
jgi:hypothetical protein